MPKNSFAIIIWGWVILSFLLQSLDSTLEASAEPTGPDSVVPYVVLSLEDENKTGHVAPGESCQVMFNGTASITCPPSSRMEVTLAVIPRQCYAYITPPTIYVYRSGDVPFEVRVILDDEESCKTFPTITVGGMWKILPSGREGVANPEEGVMGTITIAPFYVFSVHSGKSYDEASPGSNIYYGLTIINEGNDDDIYYIEIVNSDELADKGFEVALSHSQIEIPEKELAIVTVSVDIPSEISETGVHTIIIEVYSESGSEQYLRPERLSLELNLQVEDIIFTPEFYITIFTILLFIILGCIGYLKWRKKRKSNKNKR
jgi:hypothetical protein